MPDSDTMAHANHTDGREHLDDLAALRLADGAPAPESAVHAAHAAACPPCAARVAAFRAEAESLLAAFALADDETALLDRAALPRQVAARVEREAARARRHRERAAAALGVALGALLLAYAGWLTAARLLGAGLDLARRAGLTTVLAHAIAGWAITLVQALWNALALASQTPLVAAPVLPALALAAAIWLALGLVGPAGGRRPAPASG
jgi:hypothetical protein